MPYITVVNQRGEERQIWWDSPRPPSGEEIAKLVQRTYEPPPGMQPQMPAQADRFQKPVMQDDRDARGAAAIAGRHAELTSAIPQTRSKGLAALDAVREILNQPIGRPINPDAPERPLPGNTPLGMYGMDTDVAGSGTVGQLLGDVAMSGPGRILPAVASAPFVASGVSRASDPEQGGVSRALGVLEALGGAAGVVAGGAGRGSTTPKPKPTPRSTLQQIQEKAAKSQSDEALQRTLTPAEKKYLETEVLHQEGRDILLKEKQAVSTKTETARAKATVDSQKATETGRKEIVAVEKAQSDAAKLRAKEEVDTAKAQEAAAKIKQQEAKAQVDAAKMAEDAAKKAQKAAEVAEKAKKELAAKARIAKEKKKLERGQPAYTETVSANTKTGKERISIPYRKASEEGEEVVEAAAAPAKPAPKPKAKPATPPPAAAAPADAPFNAPKLSEGKAKTPRKTAQAPQSNAAKGASALTEQMAKDPVVANTTPEQIERLLAEKFGGLKQTPEARDAAAMLDRRAAGGDPLVGGRRSTDIADVPGGFDPGKDARSELRFWRDRQRQGPGSEAGYASLFTDPSMAKLGIYGGKMGVGGYAGDQAAKQIWGEDITPGRRMTGIALGALAGGAVPTRAVGNLPATGGSPFMRGAAQHQYEMMLTGAAQASNALGSQATMVAAPLIEALRSGNTVPLRNLGRAALTPRQTLSNYWGGIKEGWNLAGQQHQVDLPAEMQAFTPGPGLRALEAMDRGPRRILEQIEIPDEMIDTYLFKNVPKTKSGYHVGEILSTPLARQVEPFHKTPISLIEQGASLSPLRWLDAPIFRPAQPGVPYYEQGQGLRNVFPATSRARDIALGLPAVGAMAAGAAGLTPSNPTLSTLGGPVTAPMQMGRSMYDYAQYDREPGAWPAVRDAGRALANNTPIAQSARYLEAPEQFTKSWGNRVLPQVMLMPWLNDLLPDRMGGTNPGILRETESIGDSVLERLGGRSQELLPPRHDFFGRLQYRNPLGQTPPPLYDTDPYARQMADMGLLQRGQSASIPGMKLMPDEAAELERYRGSRMFETLKPFLDNPGLLSTFPDWKENTLNSIPDPARRRALEALLSIHSSGVPSTQRDIYRQIKEAGVAMGTEEFLADYARKKAAQLTGGTQLR